MRNTDHHKAFVENPNAMLVFTGPSCYVSASWYSNPQIGSTWNYMSVHVAGQINFMTNDELIAFMRKLTLKFEKGNTESLTIYDNLRDASGGPSWRSSPRRSSGAESPRETRRGHRRRSRAHRSSRGASARHRARRPHGWCWQPACPRRRVSNSVTARPCALAPFRRDRPVRCLRTRTAPPRHATLLHRGSA